MGFSTAEMRLTLLDALVTVEVVAMCSVVVTSARSRVRERSFELRARQPEARDASTHELRERVAG